MSTQSINRREIFARAHFNARLRRINTGNRQTYAFWFASALRHEYAKLRQQAEREHLRLEQNLGLPIRSTPADRKYFLGSSRFVSAVGA
jgi:hypothetical protein